MQPPPRKGNYAKFLKNLHSEQLSKLIAKNHHECDLLEDIRTFIIKRSAIERSYSEALLKISSAYLNKKVPNIPDIKLDGGDEKWNMWNVWRTVLEENEKLARARLAAVEVFQQQIAEEAKILRSHKIAAARRCAEQLAVVQKELQSSAQDVDKTKKLYFDEEHCAHDVRDKARDIEEKLKKKKGSFFQSITSLQKNSAKFSSRREQLEEKSAGARNDYLLCLAAANAHQNRYFVVDLQLCMSTMESNVFDKVAEYLMLMGRTELLTCSAMQNSFSTIRDQAKQLTREYNLQCIYLYYPVLKQHIQYEFEPCDNDPIDTITAEHETAAGTLSKEARRWATKAAKENAFIRESVRKLQIYHALRESGQKVDPNDPNGPDLETKIEEYKDHIRQAEVEKLKAEARLECLRVGGVNVDEWLQEAESLNVQDIQRSHSSLSDHPSSDSYYDSDFADGEPSAQPAVDVKVDKDYDERQQQPQQQSFVDSDEEDSQHEVDAVLEQERQRIEQLTAGWDDPTQVDWGAEESETSEPAAMPQEAAPSITALKCTAIYSYTAQNPDELTIVENEQLEVVGEGDGDGWLRARNYRGEEGYVPHNYLDVEREQSATTPGLQNQISFSSVDYTIDNEDEATANTDTANQSPDQVSVIAAPTAAIQPEAGFEQKIEYCCALYDYDGDAPEELTFDEGQVIRIVSKIAHSVDDGWWKGELDGQIGNFPSLVVELCDEYGEPLSNPEDVSPPPSAPPVFTPPEVPDYLITNEFNDLTPTDEMPSSQPPSAAPPAPPPEATNGKFTMELTRGQQQQYGTQFDGSDIPTIDITSVTGPDDDEENEEGAEGDGLGVVQIEITAATPMMEEPEHPFPPPEGEEAADQEKDCEPVEHEVDELATVLEEEEADEPPKEASSKKRFSEDLEQAPDTAHADSAPCPISSSSDGGDTTGPSTAENSVSHAPPPSSTQEEPPKQVVGGRASIPDELEPHQLARLQELKESNA